MIEQAVFNMIQQHSLISAGELVVVGVSGGADSLVLLRVLKHLCETMDFRIHVATLNHGLRGEAGVNDRRFIEEVCQLWSIPCTADDADVRQYASEYKIGIEEAARRVRYEFLASVAYQQKATCVVVAHHADDQAETILMHILRGSGTRGLRGMLINATVPNHPDLRLVRPLLHVSRSEIENYCAQHGLTPRNDRSNQDMQMLRNSLRHRILPDLTKINPQVDDALRRLGEIAYDDYDFIIKQFESTILPFVKIKDAQYILDKDLFKQQHIVLQRAFLIHSTESLIEHTDRPKFQHINEAIDLVYRGHVGARAYLAPGTQLRLDYNSVVVECVDTSPVYENHYLISTGKVIPVTVGQTLHLGHYGWSFEICGQESEDAQTTLYFPPKSEMVLRTRQPGDRICPRGLGGHTQKLKKWMINRKIPRDIRNQVPILSIHGKIAAVMLGQEFHIMEPFAHPDRGDHEFFLKIL